MYASYQEGVWLYKKKIDLNHDTSVWKNAANLPAKLINQSAMYFSLMLRKMQISLGSFHGEHSSNVAAQIELKAAKLKNQRNFF